MLDPFGVGWSGSMYSPTFMRPGVFWMCSHVPSRANWFVAESESCLFPPTSSPARNQWGSIFLSLATKFVAEYSSP